MFSRSSGDSGYDGIKHFSSSSGDKRKTVVIEEPLPNPDPRYFTLIEREVVNGFLIVKLHYPHCTNYEGVKILVYDKGITYNDILKANDNTIDPHFGVNPDYISPIARFEPTQRGWEMALAFAKISH